MAETPRRTSYDVVIVGGAIYGSSVAWFLSSNPDFDGSILVVERDPTYEFSTTARTNSCIRQQFTAPINVKISQFAAEYVKNFRQFMGGGADIPNLALQSFGYLYLAGSEADADTMRQLQQMQVRAGAHTRFMSRDQIAEAYPFYHVDDIVGGNHNLVDEGYFEGSTMFEWWRRSARLAGVEYVANEVVAMSVSGNGSAVESVTLKSGEKIACGTVVNASGPRASLTSRMAGIDVPVEPRKRYTYIFSAENRLDVALPLTIDPSGMHMRTDGAYYMAGCPPDPDPAVDHDDFEMDHDVWEDQVWPMLAHRVPQFEAIRLMNSWACHYEYNYFDHNAVVGPHSQVRNFIFVNGFSGHGLQQSPAVGRGTAEWIVHGAYRSLDLSPFSYERIERGERFIEGAII